jgi:hypothetical protein
MTTRYNGVTHVVHISTSARRGCAECDQLIYGKHLDWAINHYIENHGYRLLHVGTETGRDDDGNLLHSTVAVLGK